MEEVSGFGGEFGRRELETKAEGAVGSYKDPRSLQLPPSVPHKSTQCKAGGPQVTTLMAQERPAHTRFLVNPGEETFGKSKVTIGCRSWEASAVFSEFEPE